MVTTTFFQCLGMVNKSIFLSLSRQLIFLLPLLYLLPLEFQEKGIWMSFPIADAITIVISALFIAALFKKFSRLNDGDDPSILGSNIK
jgi:Na+-driven multidrug efflux pump